MKYLKQTSHCPVRLPLQPLAKPHLYTVDHKWRTESLAAVKLAGVPSHAPRPHAWPLSFLPRGEGAASPMGHAPYSGDLQTVPRDFCLWCTSQLLHHQPPEEPPSFGMASRQRSKPQLSKRHLGHQSAWQGQWLQHATAWAANSPVNCSCLLPVNENDYAHSLECASTAGDLQEDPRTCLHDRAS